MGSRSSKSRTLSQYIYIIGDGCNAVKIGISDDPKRRLADLQVGSSVRLKLYYQVSVPGRGAQALKQRLHRLFHDRNLQGEWFFLEPQVAYETVLEAISQGDSLRHAKACKFAAKEKGTKITCPRCSHWRVIYKPKEKLYSRVLRCKKCGYVAFGRKLIKKAA